MCLHETIVRIERVPPFRQAGPYVRWFCDEAGCNQEFVPVRKVGRLRTWHEANKLRYAVEKWEREQREKETGA